MRRWYRKFAAGVRDFSVKKTGGRLTKVTPEKLEEIKAILEEDNTICQRVLSRRTGLSLCTVHNVLRNKLELKKRPAKCIPHLLSDEQKAKCLCMAVSSLVMKVGFGVMNHRPREAPLPGSAEINTTRRNQPRTDMSERLW